ncbi:amino acid ABC transporter ATP-binding protein [Achromobacter sp. PAB15]|uniref:amino acid ABC transporter ATP-binding protein n=1 Tax=Achromobacter sp. PAB15 TaxID=3233048 RepID=UPI003F91D120
MNIIELNPLVSLRDVHLAFGDTEVLKGIDVEVKQGQAVSIIGPSGSGKSTILRCITGLLRPQRGAIQVGGVQVDALKTESDFIALRKRVGFVFQQYNLFPHLSVLENLVISPIKVGGQPRAQAEAQARELLAKVRMEHKERAYPGELSGGQQQRVAIARALTMQPELILFDEVTSALDPEMVGEVLTVIRDLVQDGLTCMLVTHEMRFAEEVSDTVYFTEAGRIVEHGPPSRIFGAPQSERTRAFLQRSSGAAAARKPAPDPIANYLTFDPLRLAV